MPVTHLTDIVVSRLKEPSTYFDETTPAFGVRVGKNRKTWIVIRGPQRLRTRVGHYPALSLADARKLARKLLSEQPSPGARITFEGAYERSKETLGSKKPRTQRDYKRMLEKYLLPKLRRKKLPDITYEQVTDITNALAPSEGAHCLAVARTFFRWCVKPPWRYIPHSPLEGVAVVVGKPRKRFLKDDELRTVWLAAERQGYPHGTIVQLLILKGLSRGLRPVCESQMIMSAYDAFISDSPGRDKAIATALQASPPRPPRSGKTSRFGTCRTCAVPQWKYATISNASIRLAQRALSI
jgi:Arm DNA-binding domain